jgi:hypothetical protein
MEDQAKAMGAALKFMGVQMKENLKKIEDIAKDENQTDEARKIATESVKGLRKAMDLFNSSDASKRKGSRAESTAMLRSMLSKVQNMKAAHEKNK